MRCGGRARPSLRRPPPHNPRARPSPPSDGTTSTVLLIGELMRQAERHLAEGLHPRVICEAREAPHNSRPHARLSHAPHSQGFDIAKKAALEFAAGLRIPVAVVDGQLDRDVCLSVARTALRTKLSSDLADQLTPIVVDAVAAVKKEGEPIDLHMVEARRPRASGGKGGGRRLELPRPSPVARALSLAQPADARGAVAQVMHMKHRLESDTRLVRGLVLDHGARHPDMPKSLDGCFVLTCNISLEYEKSEVNASFMYSDAATRERMVAAERAYVDDRVRAVIALKQAVCCGDASGDGFVLISQKGIDPPSLDLLARAGILALRRAKRRNMERLVHACGGAAVDSVTELTPACLGRAGRVYEHLLGEEAYTFVEDCPHPSSCTVLLKAPSDHAIAQMKDAVRDGLRAVKNAHEDGALLPGGGAFEAALCQLLLGQTYRATPGRAKLGVQAFAEALLVVPKTLADNAGLDAQECVLALRDAADARPGAPAGLDLGTGECMDPVLAGVYDNYAVKLQMLNSAPVVATQLLLVDEVLRAGVNMRR